MSEAPSAPLHIENGNNGHAVIRLEDARSGDNSITAGGRLDFHSNHIQANKSLGQIIYEQEGSHHQNVRFLIKGTLAGVGGKKLVINDDNGRWRFYNNYTEDLALEIKNQKLGVGGIVNPSEALHVGGNILLPTNASGVSYKLRLTGDSTHEIYSNSYTLRYDSNVGHQWHSSGSNSMTGGAGTIEIKHSTSQRYIRPAMTGFSMYASHDGKFGFVSVGSTYTFNAIQQNRTDNNTSDLIFNSRSGGSDVERMRIRNDGNVGIGTSLATQRLDVRGQFVIDNWIRGWENPSNHTYGRYWMSFNSGNPVYRTSHDNNYHKFQRYSDSDVMVVGGPNKRVGIGTSSPSDKLEVYGNGADTAIRIHEDAGTHKAQLHLRSGGHDHKMYIDSSNFYMTREDVEKFKLHNTYVKIADNLGVGVTPTEKLHVNGNLRLADNNYLIWSNGTRIIGQSNYIQFQTGSLDAIRIDSSQNVGIGTTSPSEKLEIAVTDNNTALSFNRATVVDNNWLGKIEFKGNNGTETHTYSQIHSVCVNYEDGAEYSDVKISGSNGSNGLEQIAQFYARQIRMPHNNSRIGIGTTSPLHSLHTRENIMAGSDGTIRGVFAAGNDGTGNYLYAGMKGGDSTTAVKFGVYLNSGLAEQGYIAISNQNGGRVGVNTTSPTAQFHVNNTTDGTSARFATNNVLNYIHITNSGGANHYIQTNQHSVALSADANNTRGSVHLMTSNTNRLNVTSDGKIGIGTTSPSALFEIYKNTTTNNDKLFRIYNGNGLQWEIEGDGTMSGYVGNNIHGVLQIRGTWQTDLSVAGGDASSEAAAGNIVFKTNDAEKARITNTGRLGIGLTSPVSPLHVHSATTGSNFIHVTNNTTGGGSNDGLDIGVNGAHAYVWNRENSSLYFGTNDTTRMSITSTGYVGIGTTNPSTELHVVGTIRLNSSQQLQLGGGSTHIDGDSGHMSFDVNSGKRFKLDGSSRISLSNNDSGTQNTVFGSSAGNALASGSQGNSSIGHESMLNTTTGDRNTAIGYQSLRHNSTGSENVAVGYESLRASSGNSTSNNVAIGNYVMYSLATGSSNIGIGNNALYYNNTGTKNIAIGQNAIVGTSSNAQVGNVVIGYEAMKNPTTANYNVFVGTESGHLTTIGDQNVGVGYRTLSSLTQGNANVALGNRALSGVTTGTENIGIGSDTGASVTSGSYNILMGDHNPGSSTMSNHTILGRPDTDRTSIFGRVALHSVSSDYATISHYDQRTSGTSYALRQAADGSTALNAKDGKNISFNINNSTRLTLKGNNLGIGHTNPQTKIHIQDGGIFAGTGSGADRGYMFHDFGSGWGLKGMTSPSRVAIFVDNGERMTYLSNGNVGVGTTNPTNKLEISGTFKATGAASFSSDVTVDGDLELNAQTAFYDTVSFNGSDVDLTQSSVTGLDVSVVPSKTVVLQSSALNGYQDANDSTENLYWSTMSTHNTSHITWSAGQGGYYFQFVTAGEYMIYCTLAVTDSQSNDRLNFLAYITHMSGSNQPIYSYGIGGAYIRDDNSSYDSGALGGGIRLIVNAGERVKINTELLDTETQTGSAYFNTTKSKIRIEKITYSTT